MDASRSVAKSDRTLTRSVSFGRQTSLFLTRSVRASLGSSSRPLASSSPLKLPEQSAVKPSGFGEIISLGHLLQRRKGQGLAMTRAGAVVFVPSLLLHALPASVEVPSFTVTRDIDRWMCAQDEVERQGDPKLLTVVVGTVHLPSSNLAGLASASLSGIDDCQIAVIVPTDRPGGQAEPTVLTCSAGIPLRVEGAVRWPLRSSRSVVLSPAAGTRRCTRWQCRRKPRRRAASS